MYKSITIIFILLISFVYPSVGQKHMERLKRWERKGKYAKIIRKSDKLAKEFPDDPNIFYYASLAELKLSQQSKRPKKSYKHILNSVKYYDVYSVKAPISKLSTELRNNLYSEINIHYDYFQKKKNTKSTRTLNKILTTTFKDIKLSDNEIAKISTISKDDNSKGNTKTNKIRQQIIAEAKKHLGKSYVYGAKGPKNFDCSGFTCYVYLNAFDYELPPNSTMQSKIGKQVSAKNAQIGDLIFFGDPSSKKINHVGIITKISNNEVVGMIHSSSSKGVVMDENSPSWNSYWKKRIVKIVNIIDTGKY